MREYLMNIAGAVIITVFAEVLLPYNWSKYVKIITGLIIISAIATPLKDKINFDISQFFDESEEYRIEGEEYSRELVRRELSDKINADCEQRLLDEFNLNADVKCEIEINENEEITGVKSIEIIAEEVGDGVIYRINEIYAPREVTVNGG